MNQCAAFVLVTTLTHDLTHRRLDFVNYKTMYMLTGQSSSFWSRITQLSLMLGRRSLHTWTCSHKLEVCNRCSF